VDPNILATGGATTGYANTGRSVPRSNPGDLLTIIQAFKSGFMFSNLRSEAE
jgi:hypothetical protein